MDFLKIFKEYDEYILTLTAALLPCIMSFIFKQISAYFDDLRKEKYIKHSEMGTILEERIYLSLIQLLCYVPVILIVVFIITIVNCFFKLTEPDPNILFASCYIIYLILSELLVKKIKSNRKKYTFPDFELANSKSDENHDISAETLETHFKTLLKYLSGRGEFLAAMSNVNGISTEYYEQILDYINEDGVKTYGVVVRGSAADILDFAGKEFVNSIMIDNVKTSIYSKQ